MSVTEFVEKYPHIPLFGDVFFRMFDAGFVGQGPNRQVDIREKQPESVKPAETGKEVSNER